MEKAENKEKSKIQTEKDYILSRMMSISTHSPGAVVGFSKELIITSWNPAAEIIFGRPLIQAMEYRIIDILSWESRYEIDSHQFRQVLNGSVIKNENIYRKKGFNNDFVIVDEAVFPNLDSEGSVLGGTIFAVDKTEVFRLNKLLKSVQQVGQMGGWELDIETQKLTATQSTFDIIESNNDACHDTLGFCGVICSEDRNTFRDLLAESMKTGIDGSLITRNENNKWLKIEWQVESIRGRHLKVHGLVQDNTKEQEAILENKKQANQLMYKSRMSSLGEMAAGLAHEVNNPLAIVSGSAEQLQMMLDGGNINIESAKKALSRIKRASDRVTNIVAGLKNFSKSSGQGQMEMANVKKMIDDASFLCKRRMDEHRVSLQLRDIDDSLEIYCRAEEISQVITNLFHNAIDAIKTETAHDSWILVQVKASNETISIIVEDNGKGVSEDAHKKVMDPFFTTKGVGQGTGLGLSQSKGLVESHGGELILDHLSSPTRFVMTLPVKQPLEAAS